VNNERQQADDEIHKDQLLNFLVSALNGSFGVSFGKNADFEPEDIHGVLVGATADGTSISTLCDRNNDSLSEANILHHLRTKFDLETVTRLETHFYRNTRLSCSPTGGDRR